MKQIESNNINMPTKIIIFYINFFDYILKSLLKDIINTLTIIFLRR